eukprot:3574783-Prymnesium_polylepis.1
MLADAGTAASLAITALPALLAQAGAAALLAFAALPAVLAEALAAALFAVVRSPAVLADLAHRPDARRRSARCVRAGGALACTRCV